MRWCSPGGRGTRLRQLTDWRAKPAVPFGGKFRIIDFALSNCVNSGIRRIGICTQYKSHSLIRHVQRGWSFLDGRFDEFVELLPAQQRITGDWYRGTADAVYQNLDILRGHAPRVGAGARRRPRLQDGLRAHDRRSTSAQRRQVTVALRRGAASRRPALRRDARRRTAPHHRLPGKARGPAGHARASPTSRSGSMGIYVFNAPFLYELLQQDARRHGSDHDFGKDIIPRLVAGGTAVFAHRFSRQLRELVDAPAVLARRRHDRRLLGSEHGAERVTPALDLYDRPGRSGPTRSSCRRPSSCSTTDEPPRHGDRLPGLRRLRHQRVDGPALAAVLQRARP